MIIEKQQYEGVSLGFYTTGFEDEKGGDKNIEDL